MRAPESTDLLLNCTKYGNFNLWKTVKIVATMQNCRCQILRLKCTNFDFCWGFAPDLAEGAYGAPPDPLKLDFRGLLLRGEERKGMQTGREGERIRQERGNKAPHIHYA
jgi:hypothetical protein